MSIKKNLGLKIKILRKKQNLTQEKFAEMVNIAPRTLSGIECGENFVTAETLERIVNVLHTSTEELFSTEFLLDEAQLVKEIIKLLETKKISKEILEVVLKILQK